MSHGSQILKVDETKTHVAEETSVAVNPQECDNSAATIGETILSDDNELSIGLAEKTKISRQDFEAAAFEAINEHECADEDPASETL